MRRWTHFIIKIIIIKSCFSKIMIKVASRCSVNIMIDYSFFIIGFSLMVEVSINWTEFFCKLSCQNSLPIPQESVPCRWFLMIGKNVECLSVFIYLFIYLFYFFCCRLLSTQRILTFLCKMFLVKRLIIHWSNSINKGVFIVNLSVWWNMQDNDITVPNLKM